MTATNSLTSHCPESNTSRADKMSGWIKVYKKRNGYIGKSFKSHKLFSTRKRRKFLKNKNNWEKI